MLERVIAFIERHQLLPEHGTIVVGVSGGADSLCLLHILQRICGPERHFTGVSLLAAHLDHQIRGKESADDAAAVAELMAAWQIPFVPGSIDVAELARMEKRSLEDAARLARYRFLREVAQGKCIAVAHHSDDQIETLLLHWLRGSGLSGMVGMAPRQQDIIRPLLEITRAETLAYCQEQGITPLEDSSNYDPRFLRNRIRHEVIPLLTELNPGISRTLLRNAEVARIDLEWLEEQVDSCWDSVVISEKAEAIQLHVRMLLALPLSLQHHLLRRVTAHLSEGQSPLEPRHFLLIERLLTQQTGQQERELHLPQRLRLRYRADLLTFERQPVASEPAPIVPLPHPEAREELLSIPGSVHIPATPWLARAELLPERLTQKIHEALNQGDWSRVWQLLEPASPQVAYVDAQTAGLSLHVRTRRPGDRVQPLGMDREKKVQDIFVDRHVQRSERDTVPIFLSEEHCLWVAGYCLDHRARMTRETRQIVRLSISSLEETSELPQSSPASDAATLARLIQRIANWPEEERDQRSKYDAQGHLHHLDLSRLDLTEIAPELFELTELQTLDLSHNQLTWLPGEIGRLAQLEVLQLSHNQLSRLPGELGQLSRLQRLFLDYNQLTELPATLGRLTSLEWLLLNNNQLVQIPATLEELTSLEWLLLSYNQLTWLPNSLGQLSRLQVLLLAHNQLVELPSAIGQMTRLQQLFLSSNQLSSLPGELGQLSQLQQLDLRSNQLESLPVELGQLAQLLYLLLANNELTSLPPELGQLAQLQQLDLSFNRLRQVPLELGQLQNLQELFLNHNPELQSPPPEVVSAGAEAVLNYLRSRARQA